MTKKLILTNEFGNPYPEWEQKTLGDFLTKYTDTTIQVEDGKSYSQITVSKNTGVSKRGDILGEQIGRKRQFVVNTDKYPNTLTFTRQTVMDGGIGFISPALNGSIATENMPLLSLDISQCKKEYLEQYLTSGSYYEKVIFPIKPTGSAQIALHEKDWLAQVISLPSLPEQKKIAEFFSALDEHIALTADKVKLLKEQKQGYLQQVFTRELVFTDENGERYPDWEEKRLGEITSIKMGQSPDGKSYTEDSSQMVLIQGNADMKKGYIVPRMYTSEPSKTCDVGDIIMSVRAPVGAFAKTHIKACIGRGVCAITANDYIYQYLKYHSSIGGWSKSSQGSTFESVNSTDIKAVAIPFPSLAEQEKIAGFFSAVDEQIELTENKLELLKEQKKGYLQGIFG